MHGCTSGIASLVNAEVDSMGGVVDHRGAPQLAVIEETEAELRHHYVSYEEAKRQLDFLEKGGDPLDFIAGNAASLSVQSTSLVDQHHDPFVTSDAKDSFAPAASPTGCSVESSGRPGDPPVHEANSDDNLMLFDGENNFLKGESSSVHSLESRSQNAKETGSHSAFGIPRKAYKRRNRFRTRCDGARSSSTDVVISRSGQTSLPSRHAPREVKALALDGDNPNGNICSKFISKPKSPSCSKSLKVEPPERRLDLEVDGVQAVKSTSDLTKDGLCSAKADTSNILLNNQNNQFLDSDAQITSIDMDPEGTEQLILAGHECAPSIRTPKVEDQVMSGQMNEFSGATGDRNSTINEDQNSNAVSGTKGLDSELSCNQTSHSDGEMFTNLKIGAPNENVYEQIDNRTKVDDTYAVTDDDRNSFHKKHLENGSVLKNGEALKENVSESDFEKKDPIAIEGMKADSFTASDNERKPNRFLGSNSTHEKDNACNGVLQESTDPSTCEVPGTKLSNMVPVVSPSPVRRICSRVTFKLATKVHEDSIFEEAQIIEAKRKRIAELSVRTLPQEDHPKYHWDFVLEELAWLANDFAQERLWKIRAAAQIGRQAASVSQSKFQKQKICWKQKEVAHNLAKAVMGFWHMVEKTSKEQELLKSGKGVVHAIQGYALRFLKYNTSSVLYVHSESPATPDRVSDYGILDMSWEVHLTEENLFYSVPAGAMEAYRKSIECHLLQREKTGNIMQEEVETYSFDALADLGLQENPFEEDGEETSTYHLPGAFEGSKSTKFEQKRRKHLVKAYAARSYEVGSVLPSLQYIDNKVGNHQSVMIGKRSANALNVSIPTKRVRTASRQRVLSPFKAGTSGRIQAPNRTDTSSGDTNSFQDDRDTLQGGLHMPNNLEVDSVQDFDKPLPYDSAELSHRPKKKKKATNLGSTYLHKWQMDSNYQNEQRDDLKRRLDSHQLESNGTSGLYGEHFMKKPKMIKQSLDNSLDNLTPTGGSIPSSVASQMSNMSNPNRLMKMLGGRERGRKAKTLKAATAHQGSGSPWSLFEDQALVVLVHDMGPNWELVSDAIYSTLQFKCIFRTPKECKERHKVLMDSPAGEGADSAEDSESSQPYRSTLPGIPKGSARQLFQRLQGPMEESTIKSHLEKIILIGKKQHRRTQDPKQLQLPHNSHTLALSQVCPNNLNGGSVLTPLDLCDAPASSPDILSLGYQSPHTSGLPISNQGSVSPSLPATGANLSVQASSNVIFGNNFPSSSGPPNASVRDGRFGIPRSASLSIDEQQRMQQYNQMLSGRNIQQPNMPVPGVYPGNDRGVRMLTGGNGVGIVCGLNRNMPTVRPGLQGIASTPLLNSGSALTGGMVATPNPVNFHSGVGAVQGNSMMRPRDALHMIRHTQNPEHQRQMMASELQKQVQQGNIQGVSTFGGLGSSIQTTQSPGHSIALHHHQPHLMSSQQSHVLNSSHLQGPNHATNAQQQAYAIRVAKERQIQQQRLLLQQQQQQQFAATNALLSPVQGQSHVPVSSPPNTTQLQSQMSLSPVSISPLTSSSVSQNSDNHQMPAHGIGQNPHVGSSGLTNQKERQRRHPQQHQFQQAGRHHLQQKQQSQPQQQAKTPKGVGRGKLVRNQNLPMDHTRLGGLSTSSGGQPAEKGEQVTPMIQHQDTHSGLGVNSIQPPKQSVPTNQPKLYSGQVTHSDTNNQTHAIAGPSFQAVPPPLISSKNQHHPQSHLKIGNQTKSTVQRLLHQNCQVNSEPPKKLQGRDTQPFLHPINNSSEIGTTTITPVADTVDATNAIPVVSSVSTQLRASEPEYDTCIPNHPTQLYSAGSPPLTNSGSELLPPVNQGLAQRQSSGSFPSGDHDSCVQWLHQSSQLQPPTSSPPLQQQQEELEQQKYQQDTQLLHGGSNALYVSSPQV